MINKKAIRLPWHHILPNRAIHSTATLRKPKDSNTQILKNLGMAIKGKTPETPEKPQNQNNRLKDYYETVAYMTQEDLMIQQNLDQGRQFQSFPSDHYLDRKQLIRNLPDEIDIANTSVEDIKKIYKDLSKLDKDKSLHLKYYKRYLHNYYDPINVLLQEFNGIDEKFKLLRRNEIDNLSLNSNAYLYKENLFHLPYNVVGFDKSISGFPLRTGKHRLKSNIYPQEFIQDIQTSKDLKVKLNKKDLNFMEFNENSLAIDPSNIQGTAGSESTNTPNVNERFSKVMNLIYNELEVPKTFIVVEDVYDYKILKFKFLKKFNSILETEINTVKATLQKEIELLLSSNNTADNLLMFNHQFFKTNQFKLCDLDKDNTTEDKPLANPKNMVIIRYNIEEFNMIPYSLLINKTVRARKQLFNHLFKLFRINLTDQLETLLRIKYSNNKRVFTNSLNVKISKIINYKLIKLLKSINDLKFFKTGQAVYFKPSSKNFKRLYNYRVRNMYTKRVSLRSHYGLTKKELVSSFIAQRVEKGSVRIEMVELDDFI